MWPDSHLFPLLIRFCFDLANHPLHIWAHQPKDVGAASLHYNIQVSILGDTMPRWMTSVVASLVISATCASAEESVLEAKASFIFNGERIKIARDNADATGFVAAFAQAPGTCGAPCIAPMEAAPGVATLGETEVLDYLVTQVAGNAALMVDARAPSDRAKGFIPGSVNLPYSTLAEDNLYRGDILLALGAREFEGTFNFADARRLLVYDAGPSSNDAGLLISNLIEAGYPAEMLSYYRGGMQVWAVLGFSIEQEPS